MYTIIILFSSLVLLHCVSLRAFNTPDIRASSLKPKKLSRKWNKMAGELMYFVKHKLFPVFPSVCLTVSVGSALYCQNTLRKLYHQCGGEICPSRLDCSVFYNLFIAADGCGSERCSQVCRVR